MLGLTCVLLFGPLCLLAQWEDLTESYLLEGTTQASWLGCGMSVADFNLDGLEDITLANSDGSVVAYAQLAEGGFEAAHAFEGTVQAQGVAWMDVDGDEDLDLMVTRRFGRTELYIRSEDGFTEEAVSRGFPDVDTNEGRGLAVADYDSDGDLDVYVCMYHDQGHIPLKALAFDKAINCTLGLPIVRTSVDHGTALDIAWQGKANPQSLIEAVLLAARLAS